MRNPDKPKILRSWADCTTMEDYNRYRRDNGYHGKAYVTDAQIKAQDEAYKRCLKNDSTRYWKDKRNKEA